MVLAGTLANANTQEDLEAFEKFKKIVTDLKQDDNVLVRFLKARDFNLPKAEQMLRNAINWRRENDIDNYLEWEFPKYYTTDLPYSYFGTDYEGSLILWIWRWQLKAVLDNGENVDTILRWVFAMLERGIKEARDNNMVATSANVIFDMCNLTYGEAFHLQSLKFMYRVFETLERNYPEIIKDISVINAPKIAQRGFNFFKVAISANTLAKIKIYGGKEEWKPVILNKFPKQSIPPQLGIIC